MRGVREAPRPPPEAPVAVGLRRLTAADSAAQATHAAAEETCRAEKAEKWYNARQREQGKMNVSANQIVVCHPNKTRLNCLKDKKERKNMTIGERLKMLRGSLSQREAANRVGMKQQQWRVYESGESMPGAKLIIRICETFGCQADWLLGLEKKRGRIVATNSIVVIGSGMAINNAEPGQSPMCRKCEIRKRMKRINKLATLT